MRSQLCDGIAADLADIQGQVRVLLEVVESFLIKFGVFRLGLLGIK
jgi:hypothetical protein